MCIYRGVEQAPKLCASLYYLSYLSMFRSEFVQGVQQMVFGITTHLKHPITMNCYQSEHLCVYIVHITKVLNEQERKWLCFKEKKEREFQQQ